MAGIAPLHRSAMNDYSATVRRLRRVSNIVQQYSCAEFKP